MSVVHGRRGAAPAASGADHVSRDTTTSSTSSSNSAAASATGGRPARFPSALSAAAAPFSMVPSSVRIRGAQPTAGPTGPAGAAGDADGNKKLRARRQRKPKGKPASSSGQEDELEDKPPAAPANGARTASKSAKKKKNKADPSKDGQDRPNGALHEPSQKHHAGNQAENQTGNQAKAVVEEEHEPEVCLLCADPIKFYAIGECNHFGICSKCAMRMRLIMNDRNCPMCKTPLERVIVSSEPRAFESFELWGDAAGWDSVLDEPSDMIYYSCKPHYDTMRKLREFGCRVKKCREVMHSLGALKEHLRHVHGAEFCELCLKHQTFFIQEQQVFTKNSIKAHNVGRNRATGPKQTTGNKDFHPVCQFCKRRFYGDLELFNHLERDHFKCHICKIEHEYYRNYASMETHFRREHHLCEDPKCLAMRFVVFANDIDYQGHMSSVHGVQNRLLFNFQVARGGENPIAGLPSRLADDDGPDFWHVDAHQPAPMEATPSNPLESAFPALPTPGAPAPPPLTAPAIARPASSSFTQSAPVSVVPRGQIVRNQRVAHALGLAPPGATSTDGFEEEMKTPKYPEELVKWAKANTGYLLVIERRLERIVTEVNCHSVSLRPMPPEERSLMHQLASFYGVASESFGEDARRRISFFKKDNARVPQVLLSAVSSTALVRPTQTAAGRLTFMPLRGGPAATPAAAPAPAHPVPVNRGWERIEKPKRPVVKDAWSDDEDETEGQRSGDRTAELASAAAFDDEDEA